jgi:phage terminase Nu1 subunit (DNA packaging protein)
MKMDFPSHVPEIVIAKLLSVNRRTVAKLVTKGILRKTARGFDTIESIAAHLAYQISLVAKKHGEGDYGRARSALMLEKARMARLQREKMEGSAIDSAEVEARWTTTIAATKSKFVGMPSKLAGRLAEESTPAKCAEILRAEVYENLEDLHRGKFVQKATS